MWRRKWAPALVAVIVALLSACSFNLTTANIRDVKVCKDENCKQVSDTFGPGEKVWVTADIANNVSKVNVRFRVLYDDVEGKPSGTPLPNAESTLEVEGSRTANFWITLPAQNFQNGRYKAEITMFTSNGDQKGQKTATFRVEGFEAAKTNDSEDANDSAQTENANAPDKEGVSNFGNGTFEGFCRNKISGQRAKLSFELSRTGNDITGSVFVGPPLRGSGVATGYVRGDRIELTLEARDVRDKWTIWIHGTRIAGGGFDGTYNISDGQYGVFSVDPVGE